ncbi:MAG: HupE/UreJ family protein [Gammaproteobacteria bacterium]|nr:HupE/UreJ family protein [Gammaproteobacteria bacterium]MCP5135675.1 HupE/UreJ family protein [Gammaproteobacteria bacterium]
MVSSRYLVLAGLFLPLVALAHSDGGASGTGFVNGLIHPVTGLDHVIAMVAVGLWGAQLGMPALWLLPVAFPMIMALGGAVGAAGVPLPGIEIGIAASGLLLGLAVLGNVRPPLWVAVLLVSFFAIFHGHAHGAEMPGFANPLAFAAGFVIATGLLHLSGIALGLLWRWPQGRWVVRGSGAVIAVVGGWFLFT